MVVIVGSHVGWLHGQVPASQMPGQTYTLSLCVRCIAATPTAIAVASGLTPGAESADADDAREPVGGPARANKCARVSRAASRRRLAWTRARAPRLITCVRAPPCFPPSRSSSPLRRSATARTSARCSEWCSSGGRSSGVRRTSRRTSTALFRAPSYTGTLSARRLARRRLRSKPADPKLLVGGRCGGELQSRARSKMTKTLSSGGVRARTAPTRNRDFAPKGTRAPTSARRAVARGVVLLLN